MNHETIASKLRIAVPVGTAMLLLLFTVALRFLPSNQEKTSRVEDTVATSVVATDPADTRWNDLPYTGHVITDAVRSDEENRERAVTWSVPTEIVAPLLYELERTAAAQRYDARMSDEGWTITAAFGRTGNETGIGSDGESQTPSMSRREWITAFEEVLSSPTDLPGVAAAAEPEAPPDTESGTGGSGYVRIESRGRMNWLWDAEVLRLEPAR